MKEKNDWPNMHETWYKGVALVVTLPSAALFQHSPAGDSERESCEPQNPQHSPPPTRSSIPFPALFLPSPSVSPLSSPYLSAFSFSAVALGPAALYTPFDPSKPGEAWLMDNAQLSALNAWLKSCGFQEGWGSSPGMLLVWEAGVFVRAGHSEFESGAVYIIVNRVPQWQK